MRVEKGPSTEHARPRPRRTGAAARVEAFDCSRMLDAVSEGLVIYGLGGQILQANRVALELLGEELSEYMWLPHPERMARMDMRTEDGRPVTPEESPLLRALAGETVRGFRFRFRFPDGRTTHLISTAAPVTDETGRVAAVVATYTDVTELAELVRLRDEIVSIVAHDLRQPLSAILTNAEIVAMLSRDGKSDEAAATSEAIARAAARMNSIIQDLVDGVRMEPGRIVLNRRPVNLSENLQELLRRTLAPLEQRRIRLAADADLPPVWADPDRLDRLVLNLITNALKYSGPEAPVDVSARRSGGDALIEVRDRGPGVPPEEVPCIFGRFYRSPRPSGKEGAGLGLYISRVLAEAHGGRIGVESPPDGGSLFRVTLPIEPPGLPPG